MDPTNLFEGYNSYLYKLHVIDIQFHSKMYMGNSEMFRIGTNIEIAS